MPDENFNKKPNNAEKGHTDHLKDRKKPNFSCGIAIPLSQKKHLNYKSIKEFFFEIKIKSCLAMYSRTDRP